MPRTLRLSRYLVNSLVVVFMMGIATNVLYIGRDELVDSSSSSRGIDFGWMPIMTARGASARISNTKLRSTATTIQSNELGGMSWLAALPEDDQLLRHRSRSKAVLPTKSTDLEEHFISLIASSTQSQSTNSQSTKETTSWHSTNEPTTNETDCCRVTGDGPEHDRSVPRCVDTCWTPRACHDPAYPYTSMEEKELFSPWMPSDEQAAQLQESCDEFMTNDEERSRLASPRWCQQTADKEHHTTISARTSIPTGCSRFGMAALSGPFDRTFVFPSPAGKKKRLAFCAIPKVGMTQWVQFLRYTVGAADYQSVPHWKDDVMRLMRFDRMRPETQRSILNDTNNQRWTKAVFLRDPAERLLSSYLDKVQDKESNTTFESFVRGLAAEDSDCVAGTKQVSKQGLTWCSDPHWRPQVWSCGLWELLPHFEFVGAMNNQVDTATKALLQTVGLWESHGKHYRTGISGPGQDACSLHPPLPLKEGEEPLGFQQRAVVIKNKSSDSDHGNMYGHSKHSKTKLQQYYSEELMVLVKELYASDYLLWNALQEHGQDGWATGKDLAAALNPSCKFK